MPEGDRATREAASGLWRSETMVLLALHMQREAAHDTILNLGRMGNVQFRDLNAHVSSFQRLFTNDVRRCEDSERRIRFFEDQLKKSRRIPNTDYPDSTKETLDTLEPRLENWEAELRDLNSRYEELVNQRNSSLEFKEVLDKDPSFFRGEQLLSASDANQPLVDSADAGESGPGFRMGGLRYLTGVINDEKYSLFERLVFRATRGNMFMRSSDCGGDVFTDPVTRKPIKKKVFVVFFSAQRAHDKIKKLCESQSATIYPYNIDNPAEVREMQNRVNETLENLNRVIQATEKVRDELLQKIEGELYSWKITVITEKSVYNILNMLSFKGQTVLAECWAPKDQIPAIDHALEQAGRSSGAQVQSFMEQMVVTGGQPTYFRTNKFTSVYQGIVDSYGVGRYKEINPAVFTIMTFPFLFGVMYGDIGHGVVLTIFALFLIIREKAFLNKPLNEIFAIIFGGRYLLVLMGLFAIYMGFLYNDFFAMMVGPFGQHSFWTFPNDAGKECDPYYAQWKTVSADNSTQACKKMDGAVYPIGMDPNWQQTDGKLEFVNGIKMKMAVILGVIQMLLGEILSLMNYVYFMDMKHIFFGVIPEIVFLVCTFGYMDVIILIKWLMNWGKEMSEGHAPPSLLETMTAFFLSPGSVAEDRYLYVSSGFQNAVQVVLLLLAVAAVPLLLIPIPVIEWRHHKASAYAEQHESHDHEHGEHGSETGDHAGDHAAHAEPFDMSEVVIRQIIHTIEYVLGTVSNTASYLRLWALSLAHAELSEVFWDFGIMQMLEDNKTVIFFTWSGWAGATVGVLLLMESLSAFLHALRLHWVEFNNKFFKGDGVKFTPYSIEELIPRPHMMRHAFENPDAATE